MFCGEDLKVTKHENVLVIEIDNKLNFENHMKTFCIKSLKKMVHYKESQDSTFGVSHFYAFIDNQCQLDCTIMCKN